MSYFVTGNKDTFSKLYKNEPFQLSFSFEKAGYFLEKIRMRGSCPVKVESEEVLYVYPTKIVVRSEGVQVTFVLK